MRKIKSLEEYKSEMLNKTFGWLTVLDVFRDENNNRVCKCQCKCGNVVIKDMRKICKGHTTSCGCYNSSKEKSNKLKQSWKDNPDRCIKQSEKLKRYYIDHPELAKELGNNISEWYKNNSDLVKQKAENFSQWCKDNKEFVSELGKRHSQLYKDNPNLGKQAGEKISKFYKENPDKLRQRILKHKNTLKNNPEIQINITNKYKQWCKDNPDRVKDIAFKNSKFYKKLRQSADLSSIIEHIHPDQQQDFINGEFTSQSLIKTKCPNCGNYAGHCIHNVFHFKTSQLVTLPLCKQCYTSLTSNTSKYESEIAEYISTFYNGELIRNSRDIISPLELDLYYPEKKIAIEFNGDYWHSEQCGKEKNYHFNKFKLCKEKGIRLVSIFEHDWNLKNDKVKSILRSIFSQKNKIYARNCACKKLDIYTKSDFINKYHFNGDVQTGNISYGLYYNNELISVMSFGKSRYRNLFNKSNEKYELIRFCTKDNYLIVGGASKLFSHFINDYNPDYVVCYSDNDFFDGNVYNKLGFKLKSLGENSIDYVWVNNEECLSRYQTMSYKLLNKFPQYQNCIVEKDSIEKYIMEDLGYNRIYRCGNSVWEFRRNKNDKE